MPERRTPEMLLAAYFLARCGEPKSGKRQSAPPGELGVETWRLAYSGFHPKLGEGRSLVAFINSLKSARDAFEGHLATGRVGWRSPADQQRPVELSSDAGKILDAWNDRSRDELWAAVSPFYNPAAEEVRGVRYWAVCADPRRYKILEAVESGHPDRWTTKGKDLRAGDRLVIWKTAGGERRRGVVAFAEVTSDPRLESDRDNPFWIEPDDSVGLRVGVRYALAPKLPLWIGEGDHSEFLQNLNVARARGGTVFELSPDQWSNLVEFAGSLSEPADDLLIDLPPIDAVVIPAHGSDIIRPSSPGASTGGRGGSRRSSESKVVGDRAEEIAVEYVKKNVAGATNIRWTASLGETPGWDIDYVDGNGRRIAVEVKGSMSASFSSFELTVNELEAARAEGERYWLYLVDDCGGTEPKVQPIQNPAEWIEKEQIVISPTRYRAEFESTD